MEQINNDLEYKNRSQKNKNDAIIFFVMAVIFFILFYLNSSQANRGEWYSRLSNASFSLMAFILGLIMTGVTISSFLKYKLNNESFILKNISFKTTLGAILLVLVFSWRLIVLILSNSLITTLQISITEWIIIGIGIILVSLGIFKKSR